jgi:hypothetical protein
LGWQDDVTLARVSKLASGDLVVEIDADTPVRDTGILPLILRDW